MLRLFLNPVILLSVFISPSLVLAALEIPTGLTQADRVRAVEILGPGAAYKILGDPYPLGGYMGLELGVSYERLPTHEISKLGAGAPVREDTSFTSITLGKGLYRDIDLFLHFAPPVQWEAFTSFGAAARLGIYELPVMPIHFSLQVSASVAGYANRITTTTESVDLIAGWNLEELVIYGGVGALRSSGKFIGGAAGVTDSGATITENIKASHSVLGAALKYKSYFLALQVDRAVEAAYSAKFGLRF